MFYEYHHTIPFSKSPHHDPAHIVLLCSLCHGRHTRGHLSDATIVEAARKPKCLSLGFSRANLDLGTSAPDIYLGNNLGTNAHSVIEIDGEDVLRISRPADPMQPCQLSALFRDRNGDVALQIIENEWRVSSAAFDAALVGPRIIIKDSAKSIFVKLRVCPPNEIHFENVSIFHNNNWIFASARTCTTFYLSNGRVAAFRDIQCVDPEVMFRVAEGALAVGCRASRLGIRPGADTSSISTSGIKRNDSCPCGSNKRFKHCHGRRVTLPMLDGA